MKRITIAIDGYSSTGKSTIAKELASKLGYSYVDTGAMYRAVTLYAVEKNYFDDEDFFRNLLIADLDKIKINFIYNSELGYGEVFLNGKNVESDIRDMNISNKVSIVAQVPEVRRAMVAQQQIMGKDRGVILDGRDIGTVVFPEAEVKLFMTADADIRAKRRFDELVLKGNTEVTYEEVLKNVEERDYLDTTRSVSPLIKAEDAIEYNNGGKTREQQFDEIFEVIKGRMK